MADFVRSDDIDVICQISPYSYGLNAEYKEYEQQIKAVDLFAVPEHLYLFVYFVEGRMLGYDHIPTWTGPISGKASVLRGFACLAVGKSKLSVAKRPGTISVEITP